MAARTPSLSTAGSRGSENPTNETPNIPGAWLESDPESGDEASMADTGDTS